MKIINKILPVLIIPLYFLSFSLFAEDKSNFSHPEIEPFFLPEEIFKSENVPLSYSPDQIFETALLFSECSRDSEDWNYCFSEFDKIKKEVTSPEMQSLSEEDRGKAILKLLYRDYLKKYSFPQTKIDVALINGVYNCVSSAVLYLAAAKASGLEVYGQQTSQHAFCSVYIVSEKDGKNRKIDVETTNPYGFNPGSREEVENANQIKRYYVVPKKYYANRHQVSDGVFTGLIAGNLCSGYIKSGDYFKAIPLGAARYNLICNENSWGIKNIRRDFDILASNYINTKTDSAEEYFSMLNWFTGFINRWENDDFLQKSMDIGFHNLFVMCVKERNLSLAEKSYSQLKAYVSKEKLASSQDLITDIIILSKIDGQTYPNQIAIINDIKASENFTAEQEKRVNLHLEKAWAEVLNSYMSKGDDIEGYRQSQEALKQLPQSAGIKKMRDVFYSNCIAVIHNNFARNANNQKFKDAQKILEDGLKKFPDDRTLIRDLNELNKIRERK